MKRDSSEEYAAARSARSGRFAKGNRVCLRTTGETGTVTYANTTDRGSFVTVRLDAPDGRLFETVEQKLERIESLF